MYNTWKKPLNTKKYERLGKNEKVHPVWGKEDNIIFKVNSA